MPRACTICAHKERTVIDAMIANKQPYLQIASKFGLNQRSVNSHGKNHVIPFIESVERIAQATVLERVMSYRDEVNLPLPEKSKHVENKLWDEWYAADKPQDRVAVAKAIAQQQQEQAKLTGAYVKEAANPNDIRALAQEVTDRLVAQGVMTPEEARERVADLYPELVSKAVN